MATWADPFDDVQLVLRQRLNELEGRMQDHIL